MHSIKKKNYLIAIFNITTIIYCKMKCILISYHHEHESLASNLLHCFVPLTVNTCLWS